MHQRHVQFANIKNTTIGKPQEIDSTKQLFVMVQILAHLGHPLYFVVANYQRIFTRFSKASKLKSHLGLFEVNLKLRRSVDKLNTTYDIPFVNLIKGEGAIDQCIESRQI